ncbi:MAG: YvcK family protein, partial [Pyramidobacter sp.]|nr:YvcK family protein [Pyramidobacter sp.]
MILAVILIFTGGCIAGGIAVALLFRNSRRVRTFIAKHLNEKQAAAAAVQLRLAGGPHFVAVGGGTGLSSLLKGLKGYTRNIVALVTVTDEGGSSGRLVRDWGMLPPGDIRNCLVALSENDDQLRAFMNFRFDQGDLKGHSLGNLILLAATELSGDFKNAVELVNGLLAIRGRVLPITSENVTLVAETYEGETLRGELAVAERGRDIRTIRLEPRGARPVQEAYAVLGDADMVILGPGSLFTSV